MANRVTFLVDGFNLYFSVLQAEAALRTSHLRWLDVSKLQQIADFSFRIRAARYAEHQLPNPVRLPDGRILRRPSGW